MDDGRPEVEESGYPLREEAGEPLPSTVLPPAEPVEPVPPRRRRMPPASPWPLLLVVVLLLAGLGTAYAVTRSNRSASTAGSPAVAAAAPSPAPQTPATTTSTLPQHSPPAPVAAPPAPPKTAVETVAVPQVAGSSLPRAVAALKEAGLAAVVTHVTANVPEGRVVGQSPAAGARFAKGGKVRLRVAVHQLVAIPDLTGMSGLRAMHTLRAEQLKGSIKYVPSTEPARTVVSQWPRSGKKVRQGTSVLLNVSNGARPSTGSTGGGSSSSRRSRR